MAIFSVFCFVLFLFFEDRMYFLLGCACMVVAVADVSCV